VETDCREAQREFQGVGSRQIVAGFDAGRATSDGGVLLLREAAQRTGLLGAFARCFRDYRNPDLIEHSVEDLVSQRVLGQSLGYEDLNDHDSLRDDALFAVGVGKKDPTGNDRRRKRDRGHPLAAHATLNRLELTPPDANESSRYHKIVYDPRAIDDLYVDAFLRAHAQAPARIVLDLDATDNPLHGEQEGDSFTATTARSAICRCTSSAGTSFCVRGYAAPTSTPRRGAWRSWSGSSYGSVAVGLRLRSGSERTRVLPAKRS